jgi:PAS domain-containing protein
MAVAGGIVAGALVVALVRVRRAIVLLRAENASLKPYSERFHALFRFWFVHSSDPFLMLDAEGRFNGANPAADRLLGIRGRPLAARPLSAFLKEDCPAHAAILGMIASGELVKGKRVKVEPVDGPAVELDLTGMRCGQEWWLLFKK